ncbi:MAG TPA: AAA family ATPase, partial [Thermomicrobiales bacterium]|nr:AAA family ATPase [Thermomicrobiales bacterium]
MLRGLILENFKAFGGRRVIPIKPITLIFGPNSAGKSAIIQSLLLLKQTYEQPPKSESGSTVNPHGRYFDFGTFSDYVHMHDTDRRVEITPLFERRVANGDEYYFFATSLFNAFDLLGIGFVISSSILNETGEIYEQGMYFGTTDNPLLTFMPKIESLGDVVDIYWDEFSKQKDFVKYMTELLILKSSSIDYNHDWIDHVWNNIKDIVKDSDFVSKIDQELENARSD